MKVRGTLEKFYQYAFPMPTVLVTCNDKNGNTNIITIAWQTTLSKQPPLHAISIAPGRYSHNLIRETKEFAINFVPYTLVKQTHFCGTHTGRTIDKTEATSLTFIPSKKISVPLIQECYAHLECKLIQNLTVGDHTVFIGEVLAVQYDEHAFENDLLLVEHIEPTYYIGGNSYTTLNKVKKTTF
jgi:flavin reductase (DIM6/NTAB) family NADH-FMN oxidoreductase RutF